MIPPPPPPPPGAEEEPSMRTLELMMQSLMSQKCTGTDLQRAGAQIDKHINEVSAKVDTMATKVNSIDEKCNQTNQRVDFMRSSTRCAATWTK